MPSVETNQSSAVESGQISNLENVLSLNQPIILSNQRSHVESALLKQLI
jgi:hypothetical protein